MHYAPIIIYIMEGELLPLVHALLPYDMFNFITSSMIILACLNAVAGSPAGSLQLRQVAAPTGFEMFVA